MKNKLSICTFLIVFFLSFNLTYAAETKISEVETDIGLVSPINSADLKTAFEFLTNDSAMASEDKQNALDILDQAKVLLEEYKAITEERDDFLKQKKAAEKKLKSLPHELAQAEKTYKAAPPEISDSLSDSDLQKLFSDVSAKVDEYQLELANASSNYSALQTLPERVQYEIAANNEKIKNSYLIINADNDARSIKSRTEALRITNLKEKNSLLKNRLESNPQLLDYSNYKEKISALKNSYYSHYLNRIKDAQNLRVSAESVKDEKRIKEISEKSPALKKEIESNEFIYKVTSDHQQKYLTLVQDAQDISNALAKIRIIDKNLENQLQGLDKSLVLSRLLNREQTEIPTKKLDYNIEELIPNLNIWIYDLREFKDKLFDVDKYIEESILKTPELASYREELEEVLIARNDLVNELYKILTGELGIAISLKEDYASLNDLRAKLSSKITENLFWVKSNQPVSLEFVQNIIPGLSYGWGNLTARLRTASYWENTTSTIFNLVIPAVLLALVVLFFKKKLVTIDNSLAARLDKKNDNIYITPAAILVKLVYIIPGVVWRTLIGAVFICLSISSSSIQHSVVFMLTLHVLVFVFCLEILNPNSLAQRHFSFPPENLHQNRLLLGKIWITVIPILIVANIEESDPSHIFYDLFGYLVILICSIALIVLNLQWMKRKFFSQEEVSPLTWIVSAICLFSAVCITVMVTTGYYYTTIKLINRFAYTGYLGVLYWLISCSVRRFMYVSESKVIKEKIEQTAITAGKHKSGIRTLRYELVSSKAYKLINVALLCITAVAIYFLWHDLAGVLGYLNNIVLWSSVEIVNGKEVIKNSLTLANILLAVVMLVSASVLNRNLPSLLERLIMIRAREKMQSTSYTVKIVSSYIITALGIIFAAGFLGIHWEDLQWLVAALSVGLGFGLQEIFANFVSGLIILFERQIRVGDIINIGDLSGTVHKIRIRSTTIVDFDNKEVVIPNKQFITSALTNWSLSDTVTKLTFTVGIAYDADPEKAKAVLKRIINRCIYIEKSSAPLIYIKSLDESSITVICEVYVAEIGKRKLTNDYLCTETLRQFAAEGIEIPFNQMDVSIKELKNSEFMQNIGTGLNSLKKETAKESS